MADAKKAAEHLHQAMKGLGCDDKKIVDTIYKFDTETLQQVREEYSNLYQKDLIKDIISETSGNFEKIVVAFLRGREEYDAHLLHDAMSGIGTKDQQLIEVLVSRHPDHLKKVVHRFKEEFGKSLEEWITGDTSGHYRSYLLALAAADRDSNTKAVLSDKVDEDVAKLYRAGEAQVGTNEDAFINIFAKRSWKHLRQIAEKYAEKYSHSLNTAIHKEFSGDIMKALEWTLEFVDNRQAFFAKRLHQAMEGLGTNDTALIRIIISRREVDLYEIAEAYKTLFGKSLKEAIHSEISGNYRLLVEKILEQS